MFRLVVTPTPVLAAVGRNGEYDHRLAAEKTHAADS